MDRVADLVCDHCTTVFPDITALRRHTIAYKQAAKKGISFEEHIKEQRRKRKRLMQGHLENSTGELVCGYCELSFSTAGRLRRHNISHKDLHVKMTDRQPPAKIEQSEKIEERPKSETPQTPKICDECGKKFDQNSTLQRHLRYHARMRRQTCAKCGVLFRSVPYLVAHMAQEHGVFNSARRDMFRSDTTINVKCHSVHGEQALYHIPPDSHEIPPPCKEEKGESLSPSPPRAKVRSGASNPGLVSVLSSSTLTECFLSMLSRDRIGQGTAKLCREKRDAKSPPKRKPVPMEKSEAERSTSGKEEPLSPQITSLSSSTNGVSSMDPLMTASIPKHLLRLRILSRLNKIDYPLGIHGNWLSYHGNQNSYPRVINRQHRPFPARLLESMTNETVANLIAATSLLQIRNFVLILIQQEMRLLDDLSLVMLLYQHMHALLKLIEAM